MDKEKLAYFRQLLTDQLKELCVQAGTTVADLLETEDISADMLDRALMDSDRSFTFRIRDRESKLIEKINQALDKIEEGTYGICENCGEDIALERLQARPVTGYCITCKVRQENLESTGRSPFQSRSSSLS